MYALISWDGAGDRPGGGDGGGEANGGDEGGGGGGGVGDVGLDGDVVGTSGQQINRALVGTVGHKERHRVTPLR